tara:strand:- start:214 stop:786 length:573 start_codon:yes stop_codon:yes gene_type:complete
MSLSPHDILKAYEALSVEDKSNLDWKIVKQNKSWESMRVAVRIYLEENGSLSLKAARDLNLVPIKTTSITFVRCVIKPLRKEGYNIIEQSGVLPRNAILYHTPGNAGVGDITKQVFTKPSREAALFVVENLINGQTGRLDVSKLMTTKQFPFLKEVKPKKQFEVLLIDEAGKYNCVKTSKPFVFIREVSA